MDATVAMRDTLLNSKVRRVAFINQRALSAGALIALGCDTIVMGKGGAIGAAAPVIGGAGESRPADEKSVSYVRKEFRATAESRDRSRGLARVSPRTGLFRLEIYTRAARPDASTGLGCLWRGISAHSAHR